MLDLLAVLLEYYLFKESACFINFNYFFNLLLIEDRHLEERWLVLILEWDWLEHAERQWMLEKDWEDAVLVVWEERSREVWSEIMGRR